MKQKAKVLIEYDGNILLLNPIGKKKKTLIGGTVDKGESVLQSAVREAWEEAGIVLDPLELNTAYRQLIRVDGKWILFHCFLVRNTPFIFELKEKHKFQQLDWIPLNEGLKKLRGIERIAAKKLIKKFISNNVEQSFSLGA
jgi:8-oxo-dGTP pyrophosphatase MutT (NUDIX family)